MADWLSHFAVAYHSAVYRGHWSLTSKTSTYSLETLFLGINLNLDCIFFYLSFSFSLSLSCLHVSGAFWKNHRKALMGRDSGNRVLPQTAQKAADYSKIKEWKDPEYKKLWMDPTIMPFLLFWKIRLENKKTHSWEYTAKTKNAVW